MTMTLAEVNSLDREGFIAALGGIFEHSPWVVERAWASRPFATLAGLHETMVRAVERASLEQQLSLISPRSRLRHFDISHLDLPCQPPVERLLYQHLRCGCESFGVGSED